MTIPSSQVILYAASATDYQIALGVAAMTGIPARNVTGSFTAAWTDVAHGGHFVIAVGGAALNALYYNPCGWTNPGEASVGHTPFDMIATPRDTWPGPNFFVNAAGVSAADTLQLASAFTCFAVTGSLPQVFPSYPHPIAPTEHCTGQSSVQCPCSAVTKPPVSPTPTPSPVVHSLPYWGVDSAAAVTSSFYQCVTERYGQPVFWGRYIKTVTGVSDGLTSSEVSFLHQHGVRILPIYNNFGSAVGNANGTAQAHAAIAAAEALGMPKGVVAFADVEVNYAVDAAWIQGFVDTMSSSPYVAGIYHNPISGPFSAAYCQAVQNDPKVAKNVILWSNEREVGITTKANAPAWHPATPPCAGRILAWQYGENGAACPNPIDTNLIDPSLLQYLW